MIQVAESRDLFPIPPLAGRALWFDQLERRLLPAPSNHPHAPAAPASILIADADKSLCRTIQESLRQRGTTVATAANGLECMAKLREFLPDVLVLEAELPWGGGDGVLTLLQDEPDLMPPVVLLLASGRDRGLLHRVLSFPVEDYLFKPVTAPRLAERIQTLLGFDDDSAWRYETAPVRSRTV
jgi:CheY-like chemotaxis protein